MQVENWHLVKKLIDVKHNPAFVTKMFMGPQPKPKNKQKHDRIKTNN